MYDTLRHNKELALYVTDFQELSHPPTTSRVSLKSAVGLISGNGNHCDYFVGEIRRFVGERRVIEDFYAGQDVRGNDVRVVFIENGEFPREVQWSIPPRLMNLQNWVESSSDLSGSLYMVYILDVGADPGFDIRCH
ncbi:MAG: hypothetical protein QXT73_06240 [Candidatus Methanomethylicaceae archaeon]